MVVTKKTHNPTQISLNQKIYRVELDSLFNNGRFVLKVLHPKPLSWF